MSLFGGGSEDEKARRLLDKAVERAKTRPLRGSPCAICEHVSRFELPYGSAEEPAVLCVTCDMAYEMPRLSA